MRCHIQPNAQADEFCGLHGDRLKERPHAPPVDGKANQRLIARTFDLARTDITLVRGLGSRQKDLAITASSTLAVDGAVVE